MEISMKDLFPACISVLDNAKTPLHYKTITNLALKSLGVHPSSVNLIKEIENVREKLLIAGQRGTFYTGAPLYAGALRSWFVSDAQISMTLDCIEIPGSAKAGADGAFESLMRAPFMVIHNPSLANTERLNRARSSGLVLEKHVAQWFQREYPDFFSDAENSGIWTRHCSHDFSLTVAGRKFLIDVAGPDDRGNFGKRGRKSSTDIHLLCRIAGDSCFFEGVVRGNAYQTDIDPQQIFSPTAFIVWLNCAKAGIDYSHAAPRVSHQKAAPEAA